MPVLDISSKNEEGPSDGLFQIEWPAVDEIDPECNVTVDTEINIINSDRLGSSSAWAQYSLQDRTMSINLQNGAFMNLESDEIIIVIVTNSMVSSNVDEEKLVLAIADLTFSVRLETNITAANDDALTCTSQECEREPFPGVQIEEDTADYEVSLPQKTIKF